MTTDPKLDLFQPIGQAVETIDTVPEGAADADAEADEPQVVDNIESLCMNCEEQGMTRLFLTRIPFFKEVVLMSFECPHCHFRNSEIQSVCISRAPAAGDPGLTHVHLHRRDKSKSVDANTYSKSLRKPT